jgi:uncharacterized protein involved in exopolysaccharide biosynthesis
MSQENNQIPADPQKNTQQIIYVPAPYYGPNDDDTIDLRKVWQTIWEGKWFIAGFTLTCTLIAVFVTLFILPVTYKSEAVLMPTQKDSSQMAKFAGLVSNLPIAIPGMQDQGAETILAFLKSRTLKQRLIEKYDLLQHYNADIWDPEKKTWTVKDPKKIPTVVRALQKDLLGDYYSVSQDKKTLLISLSWEDEDPAFAAKMLNAVIQELQSYLHNDYETDAQRERQFVEEQLANAVKELNYWEKQVPTQNITLSTIQRERLAAQTVYTELRKQLELAKISEAKEMINFKIIDKPFVPEKNFKPFKILICGITFIVTGMISIFVFFILRSAKLQS